MRTAAVRTSAESQTIGVVSATAGDVNVDNDVACGYICQVKPITYQRAARKTLTRKPHSEAQRIMAKIEAYAADPAAQANNVKALQGRPGLRLRVGDWRVIMLDGEVLDILDICSRGSIY